MRDGLRRLEPRWRRQMAQAPMQWAEEPSRTPPPRRAVPDEPSAPLLVAEGCSPKVTPEGSIAFDKPSTK